MSETGDARSTGFEGEASKERELPRQRQEPSDIEAQKEAVVEAVLNTPRKNQLEVAAEVMDLLSPVDREKLRLRFLPSASIQDADRATSMWIWKVTVFVFVLILLISVLTLSVATLWFPHAARQIILTVVTTAAGILAGFITGRSSGGSSSS